MAKRFKWTAEIWVDETWVADGFVLTADRLKSWIENDLQFSYAHETGCRIIEAPTEADIAKAQGFASVNAMRVANKKDRQSK